MNEILTLTGNPSRRRGKKRRSAAQRAATRRMLAANRSKYTRNPSKRRRRKSTAVVAASPVRRRRSGSRKVARRSGRRSSGGMRSLGRGLVGNAMNLAKAGAIGGAGGIIVDIGMGFLGKAMPSTPMLTSRVNADGSTNYVYFATKLAMAALIGMYGTRLTRYAPAMAVGAMTVTGYELIRGFIPQGADSIIPLGGVGWFNPGRIAGQGMGRIMRTGNVGLLRPLASPMARTLNPVGNAGTTAAMALQGARHLQTRHRF